MRCSLNSIGGVHKSNYRPIDKVWVSQRARLGATGRYHHCCSARIENPPDPTQPVDRAAYDSKAPKRWP